MPEIEMPRSEGFEDLPVRAGQVLDGKFHVEKIIGEGAMGLVVEATHLALDERVALKFLRREALARPEIVARFAREARAAAKIQNDHVARVFDVGGTEDGSPFIVMELLVGRDLETTLASKGPLEVGEAVEYVIQACEGLAAAHALGIVHRDIKPGNIFITEQAGLQQAKLLDFGISKAGLARDFQNIDGQSSDTTQIMGSPHYMSPEQIRSTRDVDPRADIWSVGIVLFELLTGRTPFEGTEVTGIIARVLHEEPRKVRALRPELPPELEAIIDRCLSKEPAGRYQTAAELAEALLPFAPKRARTSVERAKAMITRASGNAPPPDSIPPPRPSGTTRASKDEGPTLTAATAVVVPPPSKQSQRGYAYVAIAAVILGLAGGAYAFAVPRLSPSAGASATAAPPASAPEIASEPKTSLGVATNPTAEQPSEPAPSEPTSTAGASAPGTSTARPLPATATTPAAAKMVRSRPARPARSAPSPSASRPPEPDTDIRHER